MRPIITLLLLIIVLYPADSYGKNDRHYYKANYYYDHYAYAYAIPHLEKLIATGNSSLDVHIKLGDCYRLTGNMEKAVKSYAKATNMKKCGSITYLNYGIVLMKLMKYDEAEKNLRKYIEKNSKDSTALSLISSCGTAAARLNDIPAGIMRLASFNNNGAEYAPTLWKGQVVYAANNNYDTWKETDKWNNAAYSGIYSIALKGPGEYGTEITELNGPKKYKTEYHAGPCTFTADGKTMYYTTSRYHRKFAARRAALVKDTTVVLQIMMATDYSEKRKGFRKLKPFEYNSDVYSVMHPAISPDGSVLVFASDMPGGAGRRDLYICHKNGDAWTEPVSLDREINTGGDEEFPWWGDEKTLFFSSDGHEGLGGLDIYKTIYQGNTFSKPMSLPMPINSPYDDISQAMAVNLDSGYLSSDRQAKWSSDNIYYYEKREVYLQLDVTDSTTQDKLQAVTVKLNYAKQKLDTVCGNGHLFKRLYPEAPYKISISKEGYHATEIAINTTTYKKTDTIRRKVNLLSIEPRHRDTIKAIQTEQMVIRNKNVMDSPGIRGFTRDEVYEVGDFSYGYNKYDLTPAHKKFLDTMVAQLNRHSTMIIEIHAHTDCRGSDVSNEKLSVKRALSVVDYLAKQGIDKKRVQYKGYGSSMPKVKCPADCNSCTEEQHALNRIFEFKVLQE